MSQRDKREAEIERLAAELNEVEPYLDLAREIRAAVDGFTNDDAARVESLIAALDSIPERERTELALGIFGRLLPDQQWAILERAFGDEEIRHHLEAERDAAVAELHRATDILIVIREARSSRRLDVETIPDGVALTIGLFRPDDVRAALERGSASSVCARRIVLRATAVAGELRVIEDSFNPGRGLFVTAAYDEAVWSSERLASHELVRVGSLVETDGERALEPHLYPGGRVDFEAGGTTREGRLHLGFALLDDREIFATGT